MLQIKNLDVAYLVTLMWGERNEGDQEMHLFRTTVNVMIYLTELSHRNLSLKRLIRDYDLKAHYHCLQTGWCGLGPLSLQWLMWKYISSTARSQMQKTDVLLIVR